MTRLLQAYRAAHPKSLALWERAARTIPGGVTHDIRHLRPFPVYVERAQGARKWDVDGHEYVDYWMGHGALILGHCYPSVVSAIQVQAARGTHLGACHELEVRWAEWVAQLMPSAELVRFTMSGTEATHLAIRLARAHTGRTRVATRRSRCRSPPASPGPRSTRCSSARPTTSRPRRGSWSGVTSPR